jgi:hypothetical protein
MATPRKKGKPAQAHSLPDRWLTVKTEGAVRWEYWTSIRPDGTWSMSGIGRLGDAQQKFTNTGTWTTEDDALRLKLENTTLPGAPDEEVDGKLIELDDDAMHPAGALEMTAAGAAAPAPAVFTERQEMLTLSYLSYAGMWGSSARDPSLLYKLLTELIDELEPVHGRWKIVWGPGVSRSPLELTDSNVMFVAQDAAQSDRYAIVIRGTNPLSLTDILSVSDIFTQKKWRYGNPPGGLKPRVAAGVHNALGELRHMRVSAGLPGQGQTLIGFLKETAAASSKPLDIVTTGHSLGGTMASTVALWLLDSQGTDVSLADFWDPAAAATVTSIPFAGFSAGDHDFAAYSDLRLGTRCDRVYQTRDVVPHTYAAKDMRSIKHIYAPDIETSPLFATAIDLSLVKLALGGIAYRQIRQDIEPLQGKVNPDQPQFLTQMLWQHVEGYLALLDLTHFVDVQRILKAQP